MRFKHEPYAHQLYAFNHSKNKQAYALFCQMGTGKSKIIIDTMAHLWYQDLLDVVVILCPNGLQQNWVLREVPNHMSVGVDYVAAYYSGTMNAAEKKAWKEAQKDRGKKLIIFAMNYEQVIKQSTVDFLVALGQNFRTMLVLDESQRIKSPKAKRTKTIVNKLSPLYTYKRILSGTPITNNPLDLYTQFSFLDPNILRIDRFIEFKYRYAKVTRVKTGGNRFGFFERIDGYKNLKELRERIDPHTFIVKKEECLDLPDKIFETHYIQLTSEQKRMYESLRDTAVASITDPPDNLTADELLAWAFINSKTVTVDNVLTQQLRLRQLLGGFATDDDGNVHTISDSRIKTLIDIVTDSNVDKVIIWANFRAEIKAIKEALDEHYAKTDVYSVTYFGDTKSHERNDAVDNFQKDSNCKFFIGNPASGGVGLTLTAATTVVWYSLDYNLEYYLQANDRAHRIGQTKKVTYIHLIAQNTVDEHIMKAIQVKSDLADTVLGDKNGI